MIITPAALSERGVEARRKAQDYRSRQVLLLRQAGMPVAEIARKLQVTERTCWRDLHDHAEELREVEQIVEDAGLDAHDLLMTLSRMHDADVSAIMRDDGTLRPLATWPAIWRQGLANEIIIERSEDGSVKSVKIKRESALKVIELAARLREVDALKASADVVPVQAVNVQIVHVASDGGTVSRADISAGDIVSEG